MKNIHVYSDFPLVLETTTDNWIYGAITVFLIDGGCDSGDGYIQAPDGSVAGLVWKVGDFKTETIIEAEPDRWGVYSVSFPRKIYTTEDLVFCFRSILSELKTIYHQLKTNEH